MAYFGLEEYSLDFGASQSNLSAIILEILTNPNAIREKIKKNQPKVRSLAEKQFDYLERVLS
jgi:hypothetical protein